MDQLTELNVAELKALLKAKGMKYSGTKPELIQRLQNATKDALGDPGLSVLTNRVVHGDMMDVARQIPDGAAQCVIVDPPYNIGKDFGNDSDKQEMETYLAWCEEWMAECYRILAPNGTMFVYGFSEILALILARVPKHINRRWLVWHYTNKNAASAGFWQRSHESILALWKKEKVFNKDLVREPYTETFLKNAAGKKRAGTPSRFGSGVETVYNAHAKGALPRDVIKVAALAGGAGAKERVFYCKTCDELKKGTKQRNPCRDAEHNLTVHDTQKPMELSVKLLESCKQETGLVFVPFAGTGSECLAALQLGLPFVAADLNEDYVQLTNARLDDWRANPSKSKKNEKTPRRKKQSETESKTFLTLDAFNEIPHNTEKMTMKELKHALRAAGKKVSGNKAALIQRLQEK
jgi:site-specific DNA-methyltransferase (adenine-specific)